MSEAIGVEIRTICRRAAEPVTPGESVKTQLRRAWDNLQRPPFWRGRSGWCDEGGCWSATAEADFQRRYRAMVERQSRRAAQAQAIEAAKRGLANPSQAELARDAYPLRMGLPVRCRMPGTAVGAGLVLPYANTEAVNLHLAEISKAVAPDAHAALVADGAGWQVSDKLVVPDNITLVKLPPYAPELNPIENVWAYLRGTKLAHRLFNSYKDIVDACCDVWNSFIADPETVRSITTCQWATCQKL